MPNSITSDTGDFLVSNLYKEREDMERDRQTDRQTERERDASKKH